MPVGFIEWIVEKIGALADRVGSVACAVAAVCLLVVIGLILIATVGPSIYDFVKNNPPQLALPYETTTQ